jgi:3-dehydroquinate synthase
MDTVTVALGPRSYPVTCAGQQTLAEWWHTLRPTSTRVVLVTDPHAQPHAERMAEELQRAGHALRTALVPAGEASKCLAQVERLYGVLAEWTADRATVVLAVGGGVIGDLAGFVAATYNRGLPLVMVPTTLLAMVDSSVGGKVGINLSAGKNLVGAFHQPLGVWIDPQTLNTLPDREYRSGLAEVVKYGVALEADFLTWIEQHAAAILARAPTTIAQMVARSCRIKANIVEQDEREETGVRAVLNYGHTFGHAFEAVGGYGAWLHGEAVAAGMTCAARLAERLGRIGPELCVRQTVLLTHFGLPTQVPTVGTAAEWLAVMRRDKKNAGGRLRFILPTRIGHAELVADVPEADVRAVLTEASS